MFGLIALIVVLFVGITSGLMRASNFSSGTGRLIADAVAKVDHGKAKVGEETKLMLFVCVITLPLGALTTPMTTP